MRWTGRHLEPAADTPAGALPAVDTPAGALLAADSWLLDAGYERAAGAHWARFGEACLELGVEREQFAAFRAAATEAFPAEGRWFPRVELTGAGLALRLRRAPPPAREARVLIGASGDPRRHPRRKGPDLELLAGLRESARARGGDELLLCDGGGRVLEGALSSLLWWEDDALWTTPEATALPGVTRGLVIGLARQRSIDVRMRAPHPAELAGRETWLTSALHGIRVVSAWVDPRQDAGAPARAAQWREDLDRRG
jgi:branched-subunit amino acid aminotransferase/4-amino-4-deoxychorismate lyase